MKNSTKELPIQIAVIGPDGCLEYHELPSLPQPHHQGGDCGRIVFPFAGTDVHSAAFRASEHARFVRKERKTLRVLSSEKHP